MIRRELSRLIARVRAEALCNPRECAVSSPDDAPGLLRIVAIHARDDLARIASEVLLVDDAVVVHDERRDPRASVLRRPCDESKSADHLAIDHVVHRAEAGGRPRPLARPG